MFEEKQNTLEENNPFNIVYNYRSVSTRSSKNSKKHKIRKLSDAPIGLCLKKNRKMTENIQVQRILQEVDLQAEVRYAFSDAQLEPKQEINMYQELENCELWGQSDLEKIIPVELKQAQLDQQSPFQMNSFRNMCSFEQELLNKTQ